MSTTQSTTQLTADDITTLAYRLHGIRNAWHVGSLVTLLTKLAPQYDGALLRRAAIAAAQDSHIKTPAGIEWTVSDYANGPTTNRRGERCFICGHLPDQCKYDRPLVRNGNDYDDHVYQTAAEAQAQAATNNRRVVL